jgi:excinuclease UvrABC nuclease subunit
MLEAAHRLEFEKAALLRDQVNELKRSMPGNAPPAGPRPSASYRKGAGRRGRGR